MASYLSRPAVREEHREEHKGATCSSQWSLGFEWRECGGLGCPIGTTNGTVASRELDLTLLADYSRPRALLMPHCWQSEATAIATRRNRRRQTRRLM